MPNHKVHQYCLMKCRQQVGCVAVDFRIVENDKKCWLKSSVDHKPSGAHSFVILSCLERSFSSVLYPGYKDKVLAMQSKKCPTGFEDWVETSGRCFQVFSDHAESWHKGHKKCKDSNPKAELMIIDSKNLNTVAAKKLKHSNAWIGLKINCGKKKILLHKSNKHTVPCFVQKVYLTDQLISSS